MLVDNGQTVAAQCLMAALKIAIKKGQPIARFFCLFDTKIEMTYNSSTLLFTRCVLCYLIGGSPPIGRLP